MHELTWKIEFAPSEHVGPWAATSRCQDSSWLGHTKDVSIVGFGRFPTFSKTTLVNREINSILQTAVKRPKCPLSQIQLKPVENKRQNPWDMLKEFRIDLCDQVILICDQQICQGWRFVSSSLTLKRLRRCDADRWNGMALDVVNGGPVPHYQSKSNRPWHDGIYFRAFQNMSCSDGLMTTKHQTIEIERLRGQGNWNIWIQGFATNINIKLWNNDSKKTRSTVLKPFLDGVWILKLLKPGLQVIALRHQWYISDITAFSRISSRPPSVFPQKFALASGIICLV